jgi:hypothetical protein
MEKITTSRPSYSLFIIQIKKHPAAIELTITTISVQSITTPHFFRTRYGRASKTEY